MPRKGYSHVVEAADTFELENLADSICEEFAHHGEQQIIEFLTTLEIYYIPHADMTEEENSVHEQTIYNFSFTNYVKGTI